MIRGAMMWASSCWSTTTRMMVATASCQLCKSAMRSAAVIIGNDAQDVVSDTRTVDQQIERDDDNRKHADNDRADGLDDDERVPEDLRPEVLSVRNRLLDQRSDFNMDTTPCQLVIEVP